MAFYEGCITVCFLFTAVSSLLLFLMSYMLHQKNYTFSVLARKHQWDMEEKSRVCSRGAVLYLILSLVSLVLAGCPRPFAWTLQHLCRSPPSNENRASLLGEDRVTPTTLCGTPWRYKRRRQQRRRNSSNGDGGLYSTEMSPVSPTGPSWKLSNLLVSRQRVDPMGSDPTAQHEQPRSQIPMLGSNAVSPTDDDKGEKQESRLTPFPSPHPVLQSRTTLRSRSTMLRMTQEQQQFMYRDEYDDDDDTAFLSDVEINNSLQNSGWRLRLKEGKGSNIS